MSCKVDDIIHFICPLGKKRYGVIDYIKSDTVWVNQIVYKGGFVCRIDDIIKNYGELSIDEFRDQYPELNL